MISFGLVVAVNNLLALKNFTVFLNNYRIFEKPNWIERWIFNKVQPWINRKAIRNFLDVVEELKKFETNIGLKDCQSGMFSILHIANDYRLNRLVIHDAPELFSLISHMELEFEKLKNPKNDESYK